ncbi:hypothetical protein HBN50_06895 [Halobacteriovorax sp. GB3]|uniref:hypothetical protein n=1 Tax=Halobacteriovorax sp. GB3 TaxID=2719615 RepID=UPI002361FBD9|nr:hypothetical protein [Halobacteriovorax sp. GB3]MDD0852814.1 hypothetical protein [Halobacteriovorax sp. GB3]
MAIKQYHIALVDTFFCPSALVLPSGIELDFVETTIENTCQKEDLKGRKYHGHQVLEKLLYYYSKKKLEKKAKLKITLVTVFHQSGRQDLKAWRDVFSLKNQKRYDAYLISVGIPFKSKEQYSSMDNIVFKRPVYVARPAYQKGVSKLNLVWPSTVKDKNIKIVDIVEPEISSSLSVPLYFLNQI